MSALLEALGEPAEAIVFLDWETFYCGDYQLKKLTTESYIRDPRFQVIGVGVAVGDREPVWLEEHQFRAWAAKVDWSRAAVCCHHTHFDGFILAHYYGIKPAFWLCTLSMARAVHGVEVGGSLAKLAAHYGSGEKGKEVLAAFGKRREDFTPEEWVAYGSYCANDVALARDIFWKIIANGFLETELWLIDTTIRMFTEPTIQIDTALLTRSLKKEKERKAALLAKISADRSVLMSNDKFAALLMDMGVEPPTKVSAARTATARKKDPEAEEVTTWAFSKADPGMKDLLEHEEEEVRWVAEARVSEKSTITVTRTERLLGIATRGLLPVYLAYAKAHTWRWAGSDKVNLQNLNRGSDLRDALLALAGYGFAVADSTAIEARVLAWLAEHRELTAGFAEDRDVYSEFASSVYGYPVDRKRPDGAHKTQGNVGKTAILGLGYGMGWAKAAQTFLAGPMGAKPIRFTEAEAAAMHVDLTDFAEDPKLMRVLQKLPTRLSVREMVTHCAVARAIVNLYRTQNEPIVRFWGEAETALHAMLAGEEIRFGPAECLRTFQNGLMLPSGRPLRYPGLEHKERRRGEDGGGFSYLGKGGKKREKIYGGLLVENVTQAIARDVIGEQMLWTRADGGHIATTTHDEIVCNVAVEPGEGPHGGVALFRLVMRMKSPPPWAPGLPLNAEGGFARSYGDCK